jgi:hypothetical protein
MRKLFTAMVIPAAAILIATIFSPEDGRGVEAVNAVMREAQVQTPTVTPTPLGWLRQSADLIAQLAPTELISAKTD